MYIDAPAFIQYIDDQSLCNVLISFKRVLYKKRQSLNNFFFLMILMIHMVQRQNKVNSGDNSGLAFKFLFDCMNPIWCIHLKTSVKKKLKFILTSEVYVRYIVSVLQAFILQCKI